MKNKKNAQDSLTQLRTDFLFQPRTEAVDNNDCWQLLDSIEQGLNEAYLDRMNLKAAEDRNQRFEVIQDLFICLMRNGSLKPSNSVIKQLIDLVIEKL